MSDGSSWVPKKGATPRIPEWHWSDDEFKAEFPAVYHILAQARVDGVYRAGGSITLFCDDQRLKAVISDKQTDQYLFLTLDASKSIWEQLEGYLRNHMDEWRTRKPTNGKARS